jgi:hypothetical protein
MFLIDVLSPSLASLSALCKKPYFRRILILIMQLQRGSSLCQLYSSKIHQEILRKKSNTVYPLDPAWRQKLIL